VEDQKALHFKGWYACKGPMAWGRKSKKTRKSKSLQTIYQGQAMKKTEGGGREGKGKQKEKVRPGRGRIKSSGKRGTSPVRMRGTFGRGEWGCEGGWEKLPGTQGAIWFFPKIPNDLGAPLLEKKKGVIGEGCIRAWSWEGGESNEGGGGKKGKVVRGI